MCQNFDCVDINYDDIIKNIASNTRHNYKARTTEKGTLLNNLANQGGDISTIVKVERNGEYHGIVLELLEKSKPLLTDHYVIRVLKRLKIQDYSSAMELLFTVSLDQIAYILDRWLYITQEIYTDIFHFYKNKYPQYDVWINTNISDPINVKIRILELGINTTTGDSVFPPEWIDKIFDNAYVLHNDMNKLDSRIGKPPVTYAVIYSMIIQSKKIIHDNFANYKKHADLYDVSDVSDVSDVNHMNDVSDVSDVNDMNEKILFMVDINNNKFTTQINPVIDENQKHKYQYVEYPDFLIIFIKDKILREKQKQKNTHEVGLFVSQLQKSIRRGRYCSKSLLEAISILNTTSNYNLPEHNFLRVSSVKQMVWRLFITIIEDTRPYIADNQLQLIDLIMLTLITQRGLEFSFTDDVLNLIKFTALIAQYNDSKNDSANWKKFQEDNDINLINSIEISSFHTAIALAIDNIIMMPGDAKMLRKYYSRKNRWPRFIIPRDLISDFNYILDRQYYLHNNKCYEFAKLSSFDQHTKTYIILYYQSTLSTPAPTTRKISEYIWNTSSGINIRSQSNSQSQMIDQKLIDVQQYLFDVHYNIINNFDTNVDKITVTDKIIPCQNIKKTIMNENIRRTSFLIIFGKKFRYNSQEIIVAGTPQEPYRIKKNNNWDYLEKIEKYPRQTIDLSLINPPYGYKWNMKILNNNLKIFIKVEKNIPYINDISIPWFDASLILEPISTRKIYRLNSDIKKIITDILSGVDINFKDILFFRTSKISYRVDWLIHNHEYDYELFKLVYTKLLNKQNNIIMIGPVMRNGDRMQNSISYTREGRIWAVFCVFKFLYPSIFKINGALNFKITNTQISEYIEIISMLESVLFRPQISNKIKVNFPRITTKLWDHQKNSVTKIFNGYKSGKYGYGDASNVGAGKSLTALSISVELIKYNTNTSHSGILIMLPGSQLIKTWQNEFSAHTSGFDVIYQEKSDRKYDITTITVVITTMAIMRDHPIHHSWLLVIIDECLTIQNRNALWTEEAWKQSSMSLHLLMMSATFFRTRFDKLYYMLKMLKTQIPEEKTYLDTILVESIVDRRAHV